MIAEIATALGAIKTGTDVVKGIAAANTLTEVHSKTAELYELLIGAQERILATHSTHALLQQERDMLEKKIMELEKTQLDLKRYALHSLPAGGLVYRLKPSMSDGDPAHDLCATCYAQGRKSILQPDGVNVKCHACGASFRAEKAGFVEISQPVRDSRWHNF